MKKKLVYVLVMILSITVMGCSNSEKTAEYSSTTENNAQIAGSDNNIPATNVNETEPIIESSGEITENNNAAESVIQVEDIKDSDLEVDESEDQYILIAIEEADNQEDSHMSELAQDTQTEQAEKTRELNIDGNITDVNEINAQGGDIEFADTMTYKEFVDLGWTDDVDNSLASDTLVYVVKIYYPNGFEHYKVGTINNCEAIGIYRADNGEYLGGSFEERSKWNKKRCW